MTENRERMMVISVAIFFISSATLALELVLVRALSIGHWHHLSFLVISTALLGFGAAGTFVSIGRERLISRHKHNLMLFALGFGLAVPTCFYISQKVPLDELQLVWDFRQVFYLLGYYLLFFVPFFFAGTFIALVFSVYSGKANILYFYNMAGSAFGTAAIVMFMYGNRPEGLLLLVSSTGFLTAAIIASNLSRMRFAAVLCLCIVCLVSFSRAGPFKLQIEMSENKSFVYYSSLPDSEIVATKYSPLGRIDCVRAPTIRSFAGLSINYKGDLPKQMLIITDADGTSAVNRFENLNELDCYKHTTSAIAYTLINRPEVCIIGSGGGCDVCQALAEGSGHITALEMNRQVIELMSGRIKDFSSGLYDRNDVEVVCSEGRSFLQSNKRKFDIINISLLDSFSAAAAGLYALNESHLYTIEAIELALARLKPGGILSITRNLKTPPRDCIKMFATVVEALRRQGISNPAEYIIMIRSYSMGTILASTTPFSNKQIESARSFARDNSFDIVHLPNVKKEEINRFHQLSEPIYHIASQRILTEPTEFYKDYLYNVRPATDDRPYFFDFFKWRALPYLAKTLGRGWLVFSEWGYLILVITLAQAVVTAAIFILLPLFITRPIRKISEGKSAALVYFATLGLGFMFLEMAFIQKLNLLIGHPVLAVAVTLTGFLFFSALGSMVSGRIHIKSRQKIILAVAAIIVVGLIELDLINFQFGWMVSFSRPARIALSLAIVSPLAFFMGIPFPTGLCELGRYRAALVPWAWAINGFASVIAAVLGTLLAISTGFTKVLFVAFCCYLLAAIAARRICTEPSNLNFSSTCT
jgi:spermidine synthase